MTRVFASHALLPDGWHAGVVIEIEGATIARVGPGTPEAADERHAVVVPGMNNLHSHAFQRAMAGLAETRGPDSDNFWSWREAMYRFMLAMTPDDVEAVAAQLYVEMLEAGFCRVGEFHYLHNTPDGGAYADIAEMAGRIAAAGAEAGIGLTLLPVFYAHAGFDYGAPAPGQRRFVTTPDAFARLFEACETRIAALPGGAMGLAPHSLRAASIEEIAALLPLARGRPVHIHAAEQVGEVEACLAATGARPVRLLLDSLPVDADWCLIHATHLDADEIAALAARGAVAGLCPITEANLGDGIFSAAFIARGGRFGVGSDSNIRISVAGELCQLEYAQRLALRARNVVAEPGRSTGLTLHRRALEGGGAALAAPGGIVPGRSADLVTLDIGAVDYLDIEHVLDAWIFSDRITVSDVWARGTKQVEGGRHRRRDPVRRRFTAVMRRLMQA